METIVTKVSSCLKEIEVTAKDDEIQKYYKDTLNKYIKNVALPGFRKGKAPLSMLMKLFGNSIEEEFKEAVINDFIKKIVEKEKIQPVSPAKVLEEEYKKGESFHFKVQIEVFPEFELNKYKGIEFEKQIFNVKDEEAEAEYTRLLDTQKIYTDAEKALSDDHAITFDIQEVDKSGVPILGHKNEGLVVTLSDKNVDPEIREKLKNVSSGDIVNIRLEQEDNSEKKPLYADLSIKKVQKISYPEINEELIKKLTGGKFTSEDELKSDIRSTIQKQYENISENFLKNSIDDELIRLNPFDVANTMIDNYLNGMIEEMKKSQPNKSLPNDFSAEEYKEKNRPMAINRIKAYYIHEKIIQLENLKVDNVDLNIHAETEAQRTGISKDRLISYYKTSNEVKERLLEKKLDQFLKDNNTIIEKEFNPNQENKIITE